jgi:hypothetical protein
MENKKIEETNEEVKETVVEMPKENSNVKKVSVDIEKLNEIVEQNKILADKLAKLEEKNNKNPMAKLVKDSSVIIKLYEGKYVIGITPEEGSKKLLKEKNGREHLIVDLQVMDKEGNKSVVKDVSLNDLVASNKQVVVPVVNFYKERKVDDMGKTDRIIYTDWSSKYTGQQVDNVVITEEITTEVKLPNDEVIELKSNVVNL